MWPGSEGEVVLGDPRPRGRWRGRGLPFTWGIARKPEEGCAGPLSRISSHHVVHPSPMNQRHILWVLRPLRGGMKTHVRELLSNLEPAEVEVTVAAPVGPEYVLGGRQPAALGAWVSLPRGYARSPLGFARALRVLRRSLHAEPPDGCHAHGLAAALLCCASVRALSQAPPVAVTAHNRFGGSPQLLGILKYLSRGLDLHICAVSEAVRRSLEGVGASMRVIPNGWPPLSAPGSRGGNPCRLLYVGRLVPEKGLDVLVAALDTLTSMPWTLQVVGEGPMQSRVQGAVQRGGWAERVSFAGWTDDVRPFYQDADLLVLPSRTEGAGLVISEAMSCGVPVLASGVGGIPEVLDHGRTGWLVSPGDSRALAEGLATLIKDGALREVLGARARQEAAAKPRWGDMARRVERMYREMIEG